MTDKSITQYTRLLETHLSQLTIVSLEVADLTGKINRLDYSGYASLYDLKMIRGGKVREQIRLAALVTSADTLLQNSHYIQNCD